jgi:hypothetical protein
MKISKKNDRDLPHRALCEVFLDIGDAAARVLDNRTLASLIAHDGSRAGKNGKRQKNQKKNPASMRPLVIGGQNGE